MQSYSCFALGLLSCNEMLSCEASKRRILLLDVLDPRFPWWCYGCYGSHGCVQFLDFFHVQYHLVMTNSLPWKIPKINGGFNGKIIYKWAIFHGYVSHNQRVKKHTWSLSRHEHTPSLQANCGLSNSWWAKDQQGLKALVLYWGEGCRNYHPPTLGKGFRGCKQKHPQYKCVTMCV